MSLLRMNKHPKITWYLKKNSDTKKDTLKQVKKNSEKEVKNIGNIKNLKENKINILRKMGRQHCNNCKTM